MEQPSTNPATPPLPLREVGILLVKHHGLHEGLWDVALHIGVSIGQLGVSPDKSYPGAMFTVSGVALSRVDKIGPLTVNAAEVIPAAWAGIPDEYSTVGPGGPGSGAVAGGNVPAALRAFIEILREVV